MKAIDALVLSKKYTSDTAVDFGAVKGANCQISKSETVGANTEVTFLWKNQANETKTTVVKIPNGVGIDTIEIDADKHLIITLTDGTTVDAGEITLSDTLSKDLTASIDIGTVTKGKTYPKGTKLENIIRDILIKEEAPGITITLSPSKLVYETNKEAITSITLSASVVEKTYTPTEVSFFAGTTEINKQTISGTGTYSYTYVPDTAITSNVKFKSVVTDGKLSNSSEKLIQFVSRSYWGIVSSTVSAPTETDIKGLANNELKTTRGLTYANILMTNSRIVYAYPKSFGELTSIVSKEGYDYMSSYTKTEVTVDGVAYYCYTLTVPATIETAGYKQIFA